MRPHILLLVASLILLPISVQQVNNPIYIATDGKIRVGTWLLYNVTDTVKNTWSLYNFTIVWMNDTHIRYNYTVIYPNGVTHNFSEVWNVSWKARMFWCNVSWYADILRSVNNTYIGNALALAHIYELNDTYISYSFILNFTDENYAVEMLGTILTDDYYIVLRRTLGCRTITLANSTYLTKSSWRYYNISKLIEMFVPEEEGHEHGLVWFDPSYIVLGMIVVALILGYWWLTKKFNEPCSPWPRE